MDAKHATKSVIETTEFALQIIGEDNIRQGLRKGRFIGSMKTVRSEKTLRFTDITLPHHG